MSESYRATINALNNAELRMYCGYFTRYSEMDHWTREQCLAYIEAWANVDTGKIIAEVNAATTSIGAAKILKSKSANFTYQFGRPGWIAVR
jgi:hypothetical protein